MTLPTGAIFMSQVNDELGRPSNQYIDFNDSAVRNLAGGATDMNALRGKSAYTPMTIQPQDVYDEEQVFQGTSNYTKSWSPGVTVQGGSGGYSYSWSFSANPGGFALSNATSQYCTVKHTISRFGGSGSCTLLCVVTDGTGRQVSTNVNVYFNYYTDM